MPTKRIITTPEARCSFPALFQPKLNKMANKNRYSIKLMFNKKDAQVLLKEVAELVKEEWGDKPPKLGSSVVRTEKEITDENRETPYFIQAYTDEAYAPVVVKKQGNSFPLITDEKEIYGGCYVSAELSLSAFTNSFGSFVIPYLSKVCKLRDGDRLDGRKSASEAFGAFASMDDLVSDEGLDTDFDSLLQG
jgi:hypothetical protein